MAAQGWSHIAFKGQLEDTSSGHNDRRNGPSPSMLTHVCVSTKVLISQKRLTLSKLRPSLCYNQQDADTHRRVSRNNDYCGGLSEPTQVRNAGNSGCPPLTLASQRSCGGTSDHHRLKVIQRQLTNRHNSNAHLNQFAPLIPFFQLYLILTGSRTQ